MSDRLTELQRQRALAQAQVEWFDREIARAQGGAAPAPAPLAVTPTPSVAATVAAAPADGQSSADKEAEKILERFRHAEHPVRDDVKRGCFIYFFLALGILALALTAFYYLKKHGL